LSISERSKPMCCQEAHREIHMPYWIVEIDLADKERNISTVSFSTREEAVEHAAKCAAAFEGGHGYDTKKGIWWGKDVHGNVSHIYIDD